MNKDFLIRTMTHADLAQVIEIDQVSFSLPWPQRSFAYELDENFTSRCWVAEMQGRVVAMLVGWFIVDELHVATIATHPNFRGQGVGRKILLHALQAAQVEGADHAFLEVRAGNEAALNLYRSLGFVEDGRREGYYKDNYEDAILMRLNDMHLLLGA